MSAIFHVLDKDKKTITYCLRIHLFLVKRLFPHEKLDYREVDLTKLSIDNLVRLRAKASISVIDVINKEIKYKEKVR